MKKTFLLFLLCGVLCGCNQQRPYREGELINNRNTIIKVDISSPDDLDWTQKNITPFVDTLKYVQLETTEESIIGAIDKITVFEERIYILDTKTSSLFVYTIEGKFIFKINKVGNGPGEYVQLDFFDVDCKRKQLVLTDLSEYWIMRYDMDGNYISRQKIPFWVENVTPCDKGTALFANYRNNRNKFSQEYNLFYMDSLMQVNKTYFPYNSLHYENPRIRFMPSADFYFYDDQRYIYTTYLGEIYRMIPEELTLCYKFDFGLYNFNPARLEKEGLREYLEHGNYYTLGDVLENDQVLFFTFSSPLFPLLMQGFYSKKSDQVMYSPGYTLGENGYFPGFFGTVYGSWIISEISTESMLNWKENIARNKLSPIGMGVTEMNAIANKLTLDDNPVLVFYKLKSF